MNPLAELHERLAYSAVAGTALLEEDFRLKKMVDTFASLAPKNPVFAKIHKELAALFEEQPAHRGRMLLNLLGLVDAVLYTQAGYGATGELAALPENAESGEFQPIRYSALYALMQALTTTGSGRMEVLTRTVCEQPEYFKDCRVIHALIDDLADPYGEMGALIFRILRALVTGETVEISDFDIDGYQRKQYSLPTIDKAQLLSRLKYGFDRRGKNRHGQTNDAHLRHCRCCGKRLVSLSFGQCKKGYPHACGVCAWLSGGKYPAFDGAGTKGARQAKGNGVSCTLSVGQPVRDCVYRKDAGKVPQAGSLSQQYGVRRLWRHGGKGLAGGADRNSWTAAYFAQTDGRHHNALDFCAFGARHLRRRLPFISGFSPSSHCPK